MSARLAAESVISDTGTWSLGVKVGLPIVIIGAVLLVAAVIACMRWRASGKDDDLGVIVGVIATLGLVGLIVACLFGYYPYGAEYHRYRDVSGKVTQLSNRLIASGTEGGGTSQRFVVTIDGDDHPFGIDDTRASLLKVGDTVHLRCIRQHDSGSSDDGYVCKWGSQ